MKTLQIEARQSLNKNLSHLQGISKYFAVSFSKISGCSEYDESKYFLQINHHHYGCGILKVSKDPSFHFFKMMDSCHFECFNFNKS